MRTVAVLTNEDKVKIKFEKRFSYVLIILVLSVGLLFNLSYFIAFNDQLSLKGLIVIDLALLLIAFLLYFLMNNKLNKDLKSNHKAITLVKVDQKLILKSEEAGSGVLYIPILGYLFPKIWGQKMNNLDVYYLVINGFRYEVDKEFFDTVDEGEQIERHSAKYSKTILGFTKEVYFD